MIITLFTNNFILSQSFKQILIAVDFTETLESLIKQAIELVYKGSSNIHLLHVINPKRAGELILVNDKNLTPGADSYYAEAAMRKLGQWKQAIEEAIPGNTVKIHLAEGSVYDRILDLSKKIQPQLIIIGKESNYKFFTFFKPLCPNEIAKSTDCPVLTVTKSSVNEKIKTIVVPIRHFIPKRKIELIYLFARHCRAKIHLVALQSKMGSANSERSALSETYRILKTLLNTPIEYHLLDGSNLPKVALGYAESIDADVIFVNPGKETKVSALTGRHIDAVLDPSSKLKILTVVPYHK